MPFIHFYELQTFSILFLFSEICPPPKYDDIIKDRSPEIIVSNATTDQTRSPPPIAPPPYTISIV